MPYLDVTNGSTGSAVATQLPCLADCLAGMWLCEGLGSLAGNRYCSATQVTNDSEVVNCKQVERNTILDTDFNRDNFGDSLTSGSNSLPLDVNNAYTQTGLVMPAGNSSADATWRYPFLLDTDDLSLKIVIVASANSLDMALVNTSLALLQNDPNLLNFDVTASLSNGQLAANAQVAIGSLTGATQSVLPGSASANGDVRVTMWFEDGRWDVRVELMSSSASNATVLAFGD